MHTCESTKWTVLYQADDQTTNFSLPLATFPWCATLTCATCYRLALARRMEKACGGRFKGHLANFWRWRTVIYCRLYILESFLLPQVKRGSWRGSSFRCWGLSRLRLGRDFSVTDLRPRRLVTWSRDLKGWLTLRAPLSGTFLLEGRMS